MKLKQKKHSKKDKIRFALIGILAAAACVTVIINSIDIFMFYRDSLFVWGKSDLKGDDKPLSVKADMGYDPGDANLLTPLPAKKDEIIAYTKIPTYNQKKEGYPLGCEGVSLYMALSGKGYINYMSLHDFMDTMPKGDTPYDGYMSNPCIGQEGTNEGKRTSIYPKALAEWANRYGGARDISGASPAQLIKELQAGHVVLVYVTGSWKAPEWKHYEWSRTEKGEVENNHCLCVVGAYGDNSFIINDCAAGHLGEYRISAEIFEPIYNARQFAVVIY